jgi:hypothetical protein
MFLEELKPLLNEGLKQPIAFLGGLTSGLLRLDLNQDPIDRWLKQQLGETTAPTGSGSAGNQGNSSSGPQSIDIE